MKRTKLRGRLSLLLAACILLALLSPAALAEDTTPGGWDGRTINNGDTLVLPAGYTGTITIPQAVTELTIDGQSNPLADVYITCEADHPGVNLTIRNLNITAPNERDGITLSGSSTLQVVGKNEIAVSISVYVSAIRLNGEKSTIILPSAQDALSLSGGQGIATEQTAALTLNNDGVISIITKEDPIRLSDNASTGGSSFELNGTGALYAQSKTNFGVFVDGSIDLNGGRVVSISASGGIHSQSGRVSIAEGVTGFASGGRGNAIQAMHGVTNKSPAFLELSQGANDELILTLPTDSTLNLSNENSVKVWADVSSASGGFVAWIPESATLMFDDAALTSDITLPNKAVKVIFAGDKNSVNAIKSTNSVELTNHAAAPAEIHATSGADAISVVNSATFAGGAFQV